MQGLRQHPFRVTGRLFWVSGELIRAALDFLVRCAFRPESSRALWQQRAARRHLRIFRFEAEVSGAIPAHGLLVSNHLSYLDILVLAAITPAMFVAKREVRSWPVLGWFTQLAGTLFIDRERRMHVGPVNAEIQTALEHGALVVLFPEGTSSDGRTVLPFRSSLLEPATLPAHPLHVSCIEYVITDGDAQPGNSLNGVGGGILYHSPTDRFKVMVSYGYGIDAIRSHGRGANSFGLLVQLDLGRIHSETFRPTHPLQWRGWQQLFGN